MDNTHDEMNQYIYIKTNRALWKAFVLLGNVSQVESMLKAGFHPDDPLDADNSRSPLTDLATHVPDDEIHARNMAAVAKTLIRHGATLTARDHKRLLPLDYAIAGPNPYVCEELFINTLRDSSGNQKYNAPYRPRHNIIFATTVDETARHMIVHQMHINMISVRHRLNQAIAEREPLILDLPEAELEFWRRFSPPYHDALPLPSETLRDQFTKIASLAIQCNREETNSAQWAETRKRLKTAQDEYQIMEWEIAGAMQP